MGETDQAAVLAVVNIDVTGLAGVDHTRDDLAVLALDVHQHRRAYGIKVPDVMGDILKMAYVFAGLEIDGHQRVRIKLVAGAIRTVEIRRWIADDKIEPVRRQIDGRVLPHAAAQLLVGIAGFGQLILFSLDIAVHVPAGGVFRRPDTN